MGLKHTLYAAVIAAASGLALAPAANAAPLSIKAPLETAQFARGDVVHIGHKKRRHGGASFSFRFSGGHVYFNGHRGYKHHRRGYRKHRGYYFPHGAFTVVIRPQRKVYRTRHYVVRHSHAHYRWCDYKYRSYRISDDTFQPYHGPRKRCISPYSY